MARISTYGNATPVVAADKWIGTDSKENNATKNFTAQAVTDFINKIVPCKVEQREGQYYIYSALTQKFIAQGTTPKEVHNNLPNDEKFYLSFDGHREILEELEDIDLRNKSILQ